MMRGALLRVLALVSAALGLAMSGGARRTARSFPVEISAIEYARRLRPHRFGHVLPITGVTTNERSPWVAIKMDRYYMFKIRNRPYYLSLYKEGRSKVVRLGLSGKDSARGRVVVYPRLFEHVRDLPSGKQLLRHVASRKYVSLSGSRGRYALPRLVADRRQASAFVLSSR